MLILYKKKYDGTNYSVLNISYGATGSETDLNGLGGSTDIKVIIETPNLPISVTDSNHGKMPIGSLTFTETA